MGEALLHRRLARPALREEAGFPFCSLEASSVGEDHFTGFLLYKGHSGVPSYRSVSHQEVNESGVQTTKHMAQPAAKTYSVTA